MPGLNIHAYAVNGQVALIVAACRFWLHSKCLPDLFNAHLLGLQAQFGGQAYCIDACSMVILAGTRGGDGLPN